MIGAIATWLVGKGVASRFAAPLAYLSAILGFVALLGALWGIWTMIVRHHDSGVIERHEVVVTNQIHAEVNTATAKADAAANVQAAADEERRVEVIAGVNAAVAAHPSEAKHATGPASQAALDRLRRK